MFLLCVEKNKLLTFKENFFLTNFETFDTNLFNLFFCIIQNYKISFPHKHEGRGCNFFTRPKIGFFLLIIKFRFTFQNYARLTNITELHS